MLRIALDFKTATIESQQKPVVVLVRTETLRKESGLLSLSRESIVLLGMDGNSVIADTGCISELFLQVLAARDLPIKIYKGSGYINFAFYTLLHLFPHKTKLFCALFAI